MWKSNVKSTVSPSFFVMHHSGRILTVFTWISTRVLRAFQSPTFKFISFPVGARIGPFLDSALLVCGQISYWIQMWTGVYRLLVAFEIAKSQTWRSGWRFRCELYEIFSIRQDLTKIFEPTQGQRYSSDTFIWHCSFDVLYWKGSWWDDFEDGTLWDQRR
jgi:hypothetical protein